MKKATVTVTFDDEKLGALEFSLRKEHSSVQEHLEDALNALYEKTVPEPHRGWCRICWSRRVVRGDAPVSNCSWTSCRPSTKRAGWQAPHSTAPSRRWHPSCPRGCLLQSPRQPHGALRLCEPREKRSQPEPADDGASPADGR